MEKNYLFCHLRPGPEQVLKTQADPDAVRFAHHETDLGGNAHLIVNQELTAQAGIYPEIRIAVSLIDSLEEQIDAGQGIRLKVFADGKKVVCVETQFEKGSVFVGVQKKGKGTGGAPVFGELVSAAGSDGLAEAGRMARAG